MNHATNQSASESMAKDKEISMTTATENAVVSKNVCQQIRQKIISWTRLRDALEALLKQNPQDAADIEARIQQANDAIDELNGDWVDAGCRGAPLQTLAASGTSARISMDDLAESVASGVLRAIETVDQSWWRRGSPAADGSG
jgi:hypothetical protein